MNSKSFPKLFQKSSTGKMKEWKIWVVKILDSGHDYGAEIHNSHGFVGGKLQEDIEIVKEGKNIGKKNETTPFEQACSQAESQWNKKIDKGYTQDGADPKNNIIYPMLAQSFAKSKHRIKYPCYTQPKMNGARCVHDDRYQSRSAKYWNTLSHLDTDVQMIQDKVGAPLDGEIYIHGLNLQDIGALIKKERLGDDEIEGYKTEDLEYWIYDCVDTNINFTARHTLITDAFLDAGATEFKIEDVKFLRLGKCVYVATYRVDSEEELVAYKKKFIAAGFEGGMARNDVSYVLCPGDKHCADLQKLKDFFDDEYEVVGGKEGIGRDAGCITFRCKNKYGTEFDVKPMGTVKQRKHWFKNINKYIGSMVTIRYQELTKDMIPFHGRVISVRDYE